MPGLDTALTPLPFLERAAQVHPAKTAVTDGNRQLMCAEYEEAATRTAHALLFGGQDLLPGRGTPELATVREIISLPLRNGCGATAEGTTSYAVRRSGP